MNWDPADALDEVSGRDLVRDSSEGPSELHLDQSVPGIFTLKNLKNHQFQKRKGHCMMLCTKFSLSSYSK